MTGPEFDSIVARALERTARTLVSKGHEYAAADERLHNFKAGAATTGQQPRHYAQVCADYWRKHVVSMMDLADDVAAGRTDRLHLLTEKATDALNYVILLEACLTEARRELTSAK